MSRVHRLKGKNNIGKLDRDYLCPPDAVEGSGLGGLWTLCHFSTFTSLPTPQKLLYLKVCSAINVCLWSHCMNNLKNITLHKTFRYKKKYIFFSIKSDKIYEGFLLPWATDKAVLWFLRERTLQCSEDRYFLYLYQENGAQVMQYIANLGSRDQNLEYWRGCYFQGRFLERKKLNEGAREVSVTDHHELLAES